MPVDRSGDPGPDAPKVTAGAAGPARPPSAGRAGPKRTPRPEAGARRTGGRATGSGTRAGGNGNGTPKPRPKAAPKARSKGAAKPTSPSQPRPRAKGKEPQPVEPVTEQPIGDDATAVIAPVPSTTPPPAAVQPVPAAVAAAALAPHPDDDAVRRRRGRRGRRVRRVIRRIELWSVLKLSLVLYSCLYLAVLGALIVLWGLAYSTGQIGNLQDFLADVGLENYRFYGDQMFRACAAIGALGVLAGTIITVFTAALINLVSEMTGGIRLIVIEEEPPSRS